jgi:hypothetical protein
MIAPTGRLLAVRTQGSPMLLLNSVRQQVMQVDKDQPLGRPITLQEIVGEQSVQPRFNMACSPSSACSGWRWPWSASLAYFRMRWCAGRTRSASA